MNELERHFSGDAPQSFYDHLAVCEECRSEVAAMEEISLVLREFRTDSKEAPAPRLGFGNRVVTEIFEQHKKEAWGLFSPGAAFFRRIAFASLLVLASLGSFLVTRENNAGGTDAATIMAQHDAPSGSAEAGDRDKVLVTLASYR